MLEMLDPLNMGLLALCFLTAAAFLAGFIDSVAGGGGLISLPATLVAGLPPQIALGTGKFMASLGTVASVITYARNGVILWRVAAIGVLFSLAGSAAGSRAVLLVDNAILGKVLLWLLPIAVIATFLPVRKNTEVTQPGKCALYLLTPLVCVTIGFYDGFFGPGTGSFMLLSLHFVLGIGLITASGTAKVLNLASNISSLIIFLIHGKVYFFMAVPMALANIAGNIMGSRLALRGGPAVVRRMLFISLGLLFATLVWRYYA